MWECDGGESRAERERFIADFFDPVRDDDSGYVTSFTPYVDDFVVFDNQFRTERVYRPTLHFATDQLLVTTNRLYKKVEEGRGCYV